MALGFVHPEYNIDFSINITLSDILTHLEKCDIEEDYSYLNWEDT